MDKAKPSKPVSIFKPKERVEQYAKEISDEYNEKIRNYASKWFTDNFIVATSFEDANFLDMETLQTKKKLFVEEVVNCIKNLPEKRFIGFAHPYYTSPIILNIILRIISISSSNFYEHIKEWTTNDMKDKLEDNKYRLTKEISDLLYEIIYNKMNKRRNQNEPKFN